MKGRGEYLQAVFVEPQTNRTKLMDLEVRIEEGRKEGRNLMNGLSLSLSPPPLHLSSSIYQNTLFRPSRKSCRRTNPFALINQEDPLCHPYRLVLVVTTVEEEEMRVLVSELMAKMMLGDGLEMTKMMIMSYNRTLTIARLHCNLIFSF